MSLYLRRFVAEVGTVKLLVDCLKVAMATALESQEEIAIKVIDRKTDKISSLFPYGFSDQDKFFPVILISGYHRVDDGRDQNKYFNGCGPWMIKRDRGKSRAATETITVVKKLLNKYEKEWSREFVELFGDGFNVGFNEDDGSVEVGYELRNCRQHPECLAISLVHFYYGK